MTGDRLAPIPASGQRSTQLHPHSGATGNSPLWKIPKKAELFELECMVFDRVSWSETPAFHNTLVVGSRFTANFRISPIGGDPRRWEIPTQGPIDRDGWGLDSWGRPIKPLGKAKTLYGQAKDAASDVAQSIQQGAQVADHLFRRTIEERPYTTAGADLAIGSALGVLFARLFCEWGSAAQRRLLFGSCFTDKTFQQFKILFITVWREVEGRGDLYEFFFFDFPLVLLHKSLIGPPGNSCRLHRIALCPNSYLMGMQIMQSQFVDQRLFDNFVDKQKRFHPHGLQQPTKCARQMAVDKHRMSINAVPCNVGDIVSTIDDPYPPADGFHNVQQYVVFDV